MLLFYVFLGLKYVLWKKNCLVYLTNNTTDEPKVEQDRMVLENWIYNISREWVSNSKCKSIFFKFLLVTRK